MLCWHRAGDLMIKKVRRLYNIVIKNEDDHNAGMHHQKSLMLKIDREF